jgi:hypothetical protein
MRDELISKLNRALETDHNLIEHMLLSPKQVAIAGGQAGIFNGKVTALRIMCDMLEIEQIYPFYENDVIQRFD